MRENFNKRKKKKRSVKMIAMTQSKKRGISEVKCHERRKINQYFESRKKQRERERERPFPIMKK